MEGYDTGLKDFLLGASSVPRRTLDELEQAALARGEPLAELLIAGGYLSRDEVRRAHAHLAGVPFITLGHEAIEHEALFLIPEPLARAHNIVAYRSRPGEVEVALLDLADLERVQFLHDQHVRVLPRLTTAESIKRALIVYQKKLKEQFATLAKGGAHAAEGLLRHALLSRASSVHLDFRTAGLLVRYRIKGFLHEAMMLPKTSAELVARFKEWAALSPTLHVPQEGAFKVDLHSGEKLRVRVHSAPTHQGERLVLNLFPTAAERGGFTLESVGLHGEALEHVHKLLHAPHGLIVVEGGEESGVTTLLYTLLDTLEHHRAVVTVEEDIEHVLPHATQLKVRREVGLSTAATLRAALKQDPDVVMVGDVRDRDTAELVASAAARGVLVLVGVERADAFKEHTQLKGVISVGLVGRVCPSCCEQYKLSRAEGQPFEGKANFGRVLEALKEEGVVEPNTQWKDLTFARAGSGCSKCEGGYQGLIGLQEVAVHGEAPLTLVEDGLFKAAANITSIDEVVRVAEGSN